MLPQRHWGADYIVRYDGMIRTILALPTTDTGSRTAAWRQLVDIVAQGGSRMAPELRAMAHERIAELRDMVPANERRKAAASFADRVNQPDVVAIFATDEPAVAAPVVARATLSEAEWLGLLSTFPSTSRAILRNRRDLGPVVERALASFGPSDFALPDASTPTTAEESSSQIRNLVARIEAFRRQAASAPQVEEPALAIPETFVFEASIYGEIDWIYGVAREAVIGLSIADIAPPREQGVDGQAAGAYRRRAPFKDARLVVAGHGPASGDWLISATPVFNPRNGRFAGYHGNARRPRRDERAGGEQGPLSGTALPADSLRQLVHELRTPLNAIQGFAEMIDRQILGPAAAAYRTRAQFVVGESRRLLEVVDDLDAAARLDSARFDREEGTSNAGVVLQRIASEQRAALALRGVALHTKVEANIMVSIAEPLLDRMIRRLLASVLGLSRMGDSAQVELVAHGGGIILTISRPAVLHGRDERALLDPAYGPEGEWPDAPILGLGFTLRLIANLARETGAKLKLTDDAFSLLLPPVGALQVQHEEQV
ncbi:sensor histidine kinase [Sphingomonas paeninsulae]|uniref:histidine kinase n=2 Tax=Sphingomonas paeninsulae TaxID=2319844 RepID=A0A494T8D7_SPHPE|nr:sensor histidine kinase [Sphingomonas paeninsulae]